MCGRDYVPDENDFDDFNVLNEMKRGEIFPADIVPAIAPKTPELMKWGFSRYHKRGLVINARLETAGEKPMFKKLFAMQRCLLPASHYFEWKKDGAKKEKYAIGLRGPIYMAGLFRVEDASAVPLFVILTRPAVSSVAFIHDRMPVIIPADARECWLRGDLSAREVFDISAADLPMSRRV
jgi:putative SOS response-associated peptidase YedK